MLANGILCFQNYFLKCSRKSHIMATGPGTSPSGLRCRKPPILTQEAAPPLCCLSGFERLNSRISKIRACCLRHIEHISNATPQLVFHPFTDSSYTPRPVRSSHILSNFPALSQARLLPAHHQRHVALSNNQS